MASKDQATFSLSDRLRNRAGRGLQVAREALAPHGSARGQMLETLRVAREHYPKQTRPGQDLRVLVVGPPKTDNM